MKYESYKEVFRQGESLGQSFDLVLSRREELSAFYEKGGFDTVVFIACGSSYWLSTSACMTFQEKTGIPSVAVTSGDIVMNPDYYRRAYSRPLVIAPSRSGNTTETLMAVKLFKEEYGSRVLSISEYENAEILKMADMSLEIPWANEISVCQTRSFSNLYMACVLIAAIVSGDDTLISDLGKYIKDFNSHSARTENMIRTILKEFPSWNGLVTIGNGKQLGITCEGAYICIEMTQFPANYYATLELRHGPIVMLDEHTMVCLFSGGNGRQYEEEMAAEARDKGAKVAVICDEDNFRNTDHCFNLGRSAAPEVVALYGIMVMQGFAHLKAVDSGIDPDNPKELVPWIKL